MRAVILVSAVGLLVAVSLAQAVRTPIPEGLAWAQWGVDARRSHFQAQIGGITRPRIRWVALGGAIEEPMLFGGTLAVPQIPSPATFPPRYVRYTFFAPANGRRVGAFGPFWGQAATPTTINAAVYVATDTNLLVGVLYNWPAYLFAGGQYDSFLYAPNPGPVLDPAFLGADHSEIIYVRPAYHANLGVYTDGAVGYAFFGDNFGGITAIGVVWVVTISAAALAVGEIRVLASEVFVLDDRLGFGFMPGAVYGYSATLADGLSTRLLLTDHAGTLLAYNPTLPSRAQFPPVWVTNLSLLSQGDRVDPNEPTSPLDPIPSDAIDRPIVINRDGTRAIVCASNFGRLYAIDPNSATPVPIWRLKLHNTQRIPIMGGPSIGPDGAGNETVYVVGRTSATLCSLYAIDLANGTIKWVFPLEGISRCTPTIDANGNLYIGNERGTLFCISPDGTLRWRLSLGASIRVSPILLPIDLNQDNTPDPLLIVAASNRLLYAIEETPTIGDISPRVPPGRGE
ncbi:MAG: PQQ-binding-like beta-propeller repeat protein [Armatimonadota bacterium]|nr:PQQ-binding-like beta-propeller repeat protein [Armatimonadota bacterium]